MGSLRLDSANNGLDKISTISLIYSTRTQTAKYPSWILLLQDSYISSSTQNTSKISSPCSAVCCVRMSDRYSKIHSFVIRASIIREKARNLFNPGPTTKCGQNCKYIKFIPTFATILDPSQHTGAAWLEVVVVVVATGHLCLVPSSGRGCSCSLVPAAAPARAPLPSYRRHTL